MSIEAQQKVADEVLEMLFTIDPFAIVAGGAPRDWYFGKEGRDIDVYFHTHVPQTGIVKSMLENVGLDVWEVARKGDTPEIYKQMNGLKKVFRCEVNKVPIDLMLMKEPTFRKCVDEFGVNMSKIWYKSHIHPTPEFLLGMKTRSLVLDEGYNRTDKYVEKIKSYFPDYLVRNSSQQMEVLKLMVIRGEI